MNHFKQYQKPTDTKEKTTELQTRLYTIKNVLDSSLEPKFKQSKIPIYRKRRGHTEKKRQKYYVVLL